MLVLVRTSLVALLVVAAAALGCSELKNSTNGGDGGQASGDQGDGGAGSIEDDGAADGSAQSRNDGAATSNDACVSASCAPTCTGSQCVTTAVLFGGDNDTHSPDLWTSDGSSWSTPSSAAAPPHRQESAMAMLAGKAVLFGGSPSGEGDTVNDTWTWDGTNWKEEKPAHSPPARSFHAMASLGGTVVLFGGTSSANSLDNQLADTWTWDGSDWTQHITTQPPARNGHMMATVNDHVVVFGGTGGPSGTTLLDDTWAWDGKAWTKQTPAHQPTPRQEGVFASVGGVGLLFGGQDLNGAALADTWTWDGSDWTKVTSLTSSPTGRYAAAAGTVGGQLLLTGGTGDFNHVVTDTWVWSGSSWIQGPSSGPGVRSYAAMTGPG